MRSNRIYLHEADEYVGPFSNRQDAERFMALMALFGASIDGIEIVELTADSKDPGCPDPVRANADAFPTTNPCGSQR